MGNEKHIDQAVKALGISGLIPSMYNDLFSPAAREIGSGLVVVAKAVKIALAPVEATVWGYERIQDWLLTRVTALLSKRRAKDIDSPPLSLAGPLTLNMMFAIEKDHLRDLYSHLLASAMDVRTRDSAHPSFVTVIQQLSSQDALILKAISETDGYWDSRPSGRVSSKAVTEDAWSQLQKLCTSVGVSNSELADLCIENLLRLRLLRHELGSEPEYQPEGGDDYGTYGPEIVPNLYDLIEITTYGHAFISSCVPDSATPDDVSSG